MRAATTQPTSRRATKGLVAALAATLVVSLAAPIAAATSGDDGAAAPAASTGNFIIDNPYANVDWTSTGRYRAGLHMHTTQSDGSASPTAMMDLYADEGYHVVAITDHNRTWTGGNTHRGMLVLPHTNEQLHVGHINTFWTPFNADRYLSEEALLLRTELAGGIAHLNHPGRYMGTTAQHGHGTEGYLAANDPANVQRYVGLFARFDAAVGIEAFNALDRYSGDRILWDNILTELMPFGHNVWGFANDDAHSLTDVGFSWNTLLMPELTFDGVRNSMETGAFYFVSRIDRRLSINATLPDGSEMPMHARQPTPHVVQQLSLVLNQPDPPSISEIAVDGDVISIVGRDYDEIQWVADGVVIAKGAELDLNDHALQVTSHVRAQLVSETGVALTQAFGVLPADVAPEMFVYTVNIIGWEADGSVEPLRNFSLVDAETDEVLVPVGNFRQALGDNAGQRFGYRRNGTHVRNFWWTTTFVSSSDRVEARLTPTEGRRTAFHDTLVLTPEFANAYVFFGNVNGVLYTSPRTNNTVDFTLIAHQGEQQRFDIQGTWSNWVDTTLAFQPDAADLLATLTPDGATADGRHIFAATANVRPGDHRFQLRVDNNWISARHVHDAPMYISPGRRLESDAGPACVNLLANPSFEAPEAGQNWDMTVRSPASGFNRWVSSGSGAGRGSSGSAVDGGHTLRFWHNAAFDFGISQAVTITEAGYHSFDGWFRGQPPSTDRFQAFVDVNGVRFDATIARGVPGGREWRQKTIADIPLNAGDVVTVGMNASGPAGFDGNFDAFTLCLTEPFYVPAPDMCQYEGLEHLLATDPGCRYIPSIPDPQLLLVQAHGGVATYEVEPNVQGIFAQVVAVADPGYEFVSWNVEGDVDWFVGTTYTDATATVRLRSLIVTFTPQFRAYVPTPMCEYEGLTHLPADDPLCVEPSQPVEPCPWPGLGHLDIDDVLCVKPTEPVMCEYYGLTHLPADDPLCVEPTQPVEPCPWPGLGHLDIDDVLCVEPTKPVMCEYYGLTHLPADDPLCVEPSEPPVMCEYEGLEHLYADDPDCVFYTGPVVCEPLTTRSFSDVVPGSQFHCYIEWMYEQEIAGGWPDGTFRPRNVVTREQMATFLFRVAGGEDLLFTGPSTPTFRDKPSTSPFFTSVEWLAGENVTGGWPDGTFRPRNAVTREQMAAFLYRMVGSPAFDAPASATFSDVREGTAFFHYIEWLADTGITAGWPDGTFRPRETVSREVMSAFLWRAVNSARVIPAG